jgi:uncharacterized protein DUF5715
MPSSRTRWIVVNVALAAALGALVVSWVLRQPGRPEPDEPPPPMLEATRAQKTWRDMARRIEEPRGEPVGRAARVSVPAELRHYTDRKRFLAIQVAATREQDFDTPHDYAELARLIGHRQLVEVPPLGTDYLLYGVAGLADGDPFTHHDPATGAEIPLYDGWADWKDADDETAAQLDTLRGRMADERKQLARLRRTAANRRRRAALQSRIRGTAAAVSLLERRRKMIASFYQDYERRRFVVSEYRLLEGTARSFEGRAYDLGLPAQRLRFKARLLSFLRPEARDLMADLAREYAGTFARPLPVSSLVRTLGYQRQLTETNRSATHIDVPPHASGMAFDVYTGRMAASEQQWLMDRVATLERDDRVEALREPNDHVHIFVLPDGRRPPESLIALSKSEMQAAPAARQAPAQARRPAATRPALRKPGAPARPAPRPAPPRGRSLPRD